MIVLRLDCVPQEDQLLLEHQAFRHAAVTRNLANLVPQKLGHVLVANVENEVAVLDLAVAEDLGERRAAVDGVADLVEAGVGRVAAADRAAELELPAAGPQLAVERARRKLVKE